MLLSKQALAVSAVASKDSFRIGITGIRVESDGSTIATDGHRLVKFTPANVPESSDFPGVEGLNVAAAGELEPFTLPVDACKAISRTLPRKATIPILAFAGVDVEQTNANGHAVIVTTDLENPQVFRPQKIEGNFPRYENVIPEGTPTVKIAFNPRYMAELCKLLATTAGKDNAVTLSLYADDKPMRLDATGDDGSAIAVLMPMHMPA